MMKLKNFTAACLLLATLALFGGFGAACAAAEKTDDGATVAPSKMDTHTAALLADAAGKTIPCVADSDCAGLVPKDACWKGSGCNEYVGACEGYLRDSCADPATAPWTLGINCAKDNAVSCDDGNACTKDSCTAPLFGGKGGCTHQYTQGVVTQWCGDVATDCAMPLYACGATGQPNTQVCADVLALVEGDACTDSSACTAGDKCVSGFCVGGPATDCDDKNACTDDSCDVAKGCVHLPNAATCDDGNACTTGDACTQSVCTGATKNCDDKNACTDDSCDPATGCINANNTAACDDKNACTVNDACKDGACVSGLAPDCDDKNPCTDDSCDVAFGCAYLKLSGSGSKCDDGNVCTKNDHCQSGQCVTEAVDCNDANPCTDDSCDVAKGCVNAPNTAQCTDGNACTANDACKDGVCVPGQAPNCNDANPCTDDSCDAAKGCINAPNTAQCTDGNACTANDACKDGACVPGTPPNCNDANACTDDSCDAAKGCINANNTAACDDGNACTANDACKDSVCAGKNVCTPESNNCSDGVDNDKDGQVDCADSDCKSALSCQQSVKCTPTGSMSCTTEWSSTTGKVGKISEYSCAGAPSLGGGEKFLKFVADKDETLQLLLQSNNGSHALVVLKGTCDSFACVAYSPSFVQMSVKTGEVYFIGVETEIGTLGGGFTLNAACF